jgi:hypothetical protein
MSFDRQSSRALRMRYGTYSGRSTCVNNHYYVSNLSVLGKIGLRDNTLTLYSCFAT